MNKVDRKTRLAGWHLGLVLAAVALAGCGGGGVPTPADQDKARQTLDSALTSWQKGETVEAVKTASPSILVADPKWERGEKLSKFEVKGDGTPSGAERAFTVTLYFDGAKGKAAREEVVYKVGTDPILTVFRALF